MIHEEEERKRREEEARVGNRSEPITPDMVESVLTKDRLMGKSPDDKEIVIRASLEKRNQDHQWYRRTVIITPNYLLNTSCDDDTEGARGGRRGGGGGAGERGKLNADQAVKDLIPLVEIAKIRLLTAASQQDLIDGLEEENMNKKIRLEADETSPAIPPRISLSLSSPCPPPPFPHMC